MRLGFKIWRWIKGRPVVIPEVGSVLLDTYKDDCRIVVASGIHSLDNMRVLAAPISEETEDA